jgi:hypothetical protein
MTMGEASKQLINTMAMNRFHDASELTHHPDILNLGVNSQSGYVEAVRFVNTPTGITALVGATITGTSSVPTTIAGGVGKIAAQVFTIDTIKDHVPTTTLTFDALTSTPLISGTEIYALPMYARQLARSVVPGEEEPKPKDTDGQQGKKPTSGSKIDQGEIKKLSEEMAKLESKKKELEEEKAKAGEKGLLPEKQRELAETEQRLQSIKTTLESLSNTELNEEMEENRGRFTQLYQTYRQFVDTKSDAEIRAAFGLAPTADIRSIKQNKQHIMEQCAGMIALDKMASVVWLAMDETQRADVVKKAKEGKPGDPAESRLTDEEMSAYQEITPFVAARAKIQQESGKSEAQIKEAVEVLVEEYKRKITNFDGKWQLYNLWYYKIKQAIYNSNPKVKQAVDSNASQLLAYASNKWKLEETVFSNPIMSMKSSFKNR